MKKFFKRIIAVLAALLASACLAFGQCPPPQKVNSNYQFKAAGADTAQRLPKERASVCYLDSGAVEYNVPDSTTYQWTGSEWIPLRGAGGSPSPPDSAVQYDSAGHFSATKSLYWKRTNKALWADSLDGYELQFAQQNPNDRIIFHDLQFDTAVVTPNTYGLFRHTLDQSFVNPDGQVDVVYQFGYNQNGGGGTVNPNEAEFHQAMESHFQQAGIGDGQFELHWQSKAKNGNIDRQFSMEIQKDNGQTNSFWSVDSQDWFGTAQSGLTTTPYWAIVETGQGSLFGSAAQFSISNPTTGYNGLSITPVSNGQVNIGVDGTAGDPSLELGSSVNVVPNETIAMQVQTSPASTIGIAFQGNAATDYTLFESNGAYPDGVGAVVGNSSNAAGASTTMTVSGFLVDDAHLPSFLLNDANSNNGYTWGIDHLGNAGMAWNSFHFLGSGRFLWWTQSGQEGIGATPDPSAKLAVTSTTQGFAPPRMTTVQKLAIASPTEGLQVYDLTLHQMSYWNGTTWINF